MNNKKKNILMGVLIGIIILLTGVCVYLVFFRKEELREVTSCIEKKSSCEKCEDCSKSTIVNYDETILEYQDGILKIEIDENDKEFKFNGKTLNMKVIDNSDEHSGLYFNGKIVANDYGHYFLYITEKFILVSWPGTTCGELVVGYINENGNYVGELLTSLTYKDDDDTFFGIYKENDKIIGYAVVNEPELCGDSNKIEFVYDKGKLTVKDVK